MNKQTAESKGCDFTGVFSFNKAEVQALLNECHEKYPNCKFYLVNEPSDPLSRGYYGTGYSVYACKRYFAHISLKDNLEYINNQHQRVLDYAKAEYDEKLAGFAYKLSKAQANIVSAREILGS